MMLMEVMEVRIATVAEGVGVDLEVVAVDMIVVLTEGAEVGQEEEEAWGKWLNIINCLKYSVLSGLCMSPGFMKVHRI